MPSEQFSSPLPFWNDCIEQLRPRISAGHMSEWIAPLHAVLHGDTLKLLAPNRYIRENVQRNMLQPIEEAVRAVNGDIKLVKIEEGSYQYEKPASTAALTPAAPRVPASVRGEMSPDYTFEKHVVGKSNELARAAAQQVGERPGGAAGYNPLFIYGDVGLGKTHLMQAAGHLMLRKNPMARVAYVHSEFFVNGVIEAIRKNAMPEFKRHYRSLNALLIDDIQFFVGKKQSQEEFFHTFNTLLAGRQQIIITSDRTPSEVKAEARLVSRFSGGLAVGIEPPELETRAAILERKAHEHGVSLPPDVTLFIAGVVRSNVRELEGALHTLIANANFTGRTINVDYAREALHDRLSQQERQTNIESIQKSTAEYFKLRISDLHSKNRARTVTRPRQLAMYFAREFTSMSLSEIGDRFGGRDHTTVRHACNKIEELLQTDAKMREDHRNLQRMFGI